MNGHTTESPVLRLTESIYKSEQWGQNKLEIALGQKLDIYLRQLMLYTTLRLDKKR